MTVPQQRPGRSKQDYSTPVEFLAAVLKFLSIAEFVFDFAASRENTVSACYWDAEVDSLAQTAGEWADVTRRGEVFHWAWLNPPFKRIEPWLALVWAASQLGARICVLLPAGVGSNWWKTWVHGHARVLLLNGRLTFEGEEDPYPKDLVLLLYGPEGDPMCVPGYEVWTWREQATEIP